MNQDAHHRIDELLDTEIEVARQLSITLAAERSALTGNSPDAVRQQAEHKVRLCEAMERLERERLELCAATGLPASAAAMPRRWNALMELTAGCRTANEINGYIIRVRQHQIRQLLDVVRGSSPTLYGRHGKTFATAPRALAQA